MGPYKTSGNPRKDDSIQDNKHSNTYIENLEEPFHHVSFREDHITMWVDPTKSSLQGMKHLSIRSKCLHGANITSKGAMAEAMSTTHVPDEQFLKAYGTWADGGWGMIMTGTN